MAEEQESRHITCQHPDDFKQEKKQSVNESKPVDRCPDVKHQHTDDVHSGDGDKLQNVDDKTTHQPGDASRGDYERESPKKEKTADAISEERSRLSATAGEDHTRNETEQETTTSQNPANREEKEKEEEEEEVDGPKTGINEGSSTTKDTNSEAGEDVSNASASEEEMDRQADTSHIPLQQKASPVEKPDEQRRHVETIGPATTEDVSEATKVLGGGRRFMVAVVIVVLVAMLVQLLLQPESPPPKNDLRQIDIFLKKMEKVKSQYPNQRAELWKRSRIHLKRHLQTTQPTEPVSLILTSGLKAERTMHCLAQSLAHAFSSALNASVLHIDGASKASQDSDQVKLDIDSKLQGAFEGDKPVAVIHRFEELPPGSTLIFYRYCDHENAAYKKTFLIFTVLLGEEEEIPAETRLNAVEEMVDDHLQRKFLSHGRPVSFDRMDLDKYGGLWSRISHLILPVAAEERTERDGC